MSSGSSIAKWVDNLYYQPLFFLLNVCHFGEVNECIFIFMNINCFCYCKNLMLFKVVVWKFKHGENGDVTVSCQEGTMANGVYILPASY